MKRNLHFIYIFEIRARDRTHSTEAARANVFGLVRFRYFCSSSVQPARIYTHTHTHTHEVWRFRRDDRSKYKMPTFAADFVQKFCCYIWALLLQRPRRCWRCHFFFLFFFFWLPTALAASIYQHDHFKCRDCARMRLVELFSYIYHNMSCSSYAKGACGMWRRPFRSAFVCHRMCRE